jgi:hypothetical protein
MDLELKLPNTSIQFIHLALQIIAGYWAVVIDGFPCQESFIMNVTYFAYAMLLFNVILYFVYHYKYNYGSIISYVALLVNLGLLAGMFYFTIMGYNKYNTCGQSKAVY